MLENYSYIYSIADSKETVEDLRRDRRARKSSRNNRCEDSSRCENICDRMFEYTDERRSCYSLSLKDIGLIEETFDFLKNPESASDLKNNVSGRDFDLFAEIGLESWNRVITGEYLTFRIDDDDDNNDNYRDEHGLIYKYSQEEARSVLDWIFDNLSSIGTSLSDFSDSTDILYNLFKSSRLSRSATIDLNLLDLNNEETFIESAKGFINPDRINFLNCADNESPFLEYFHKMISDICRNARVMNKSKDRSYKICLSVIYFKEFGLTCSSNATATCSSATNDVHKDRGIGYYLLKEGYRDQPEAAFCRDVNLSGISGLKSFSNWNDYWD